MNVQNMKNEKHFAKKKINEKERTNSSESELKKL